MTDPTVFVEAPARIHFGMFDLSGALGRRFGGIGAALPTPSVLVSATPARSLDVRGELAVRDAATRAARQVLDRYAPGCGAQVTVHHTLPAHHGLGSGTQLTLATARAITELYRVPATVAELAQTVGRARRSAIGTYVFALGGCVVEGGRVDGVDKPAPLLTRLPIPASWRCVLAIPRGHAGMSGDAESIAFATLPPPPERDAERVAHLVLMGLLPALVDEDFAAFGSALTEVQRINGRWFASAQGGMYAPGVSGELIAAFASWGATGIGQSSWGPAVYALASGAEAGGALADRTRAWLADHGGGTVYEGPFSESGAKVWRE